MNNDSINVTRITYPSLATPALTRILDFPEFKRNTTRYMKSFIKLNRGISEITLLELMTSRIFQVMTITLDIVALEDKWDALENKNEILEKGTEQFITLVKDSIKDQLQSAMAKRSKEWHTLQVPRRIILAEAELFNSEGYSEFHLLQDLNLCDTETMTKAVEATTGTTKEVLAHLTDTYNKLSKFHGIDLMEQPFSKPSVKKIYKNRKRWPKKQNKKYCTFCKRPNHTYDECRSKFQKQNEPKNVNKVENVDYTELTLDILIGGTARKTLIDSGAAISLIHPDALYGVEIIRTNSIVKTCCAANGSSIRLEGTALLEVEINGKSLIWTFWITPDINNECIIGGDMMEEHNIGIQWNPRQVVINKVRQPGKVTEFDELLTEFEHLFVDTLDDQVGLANVESLDIRIDPTHKPLFRRNYRLSPEEKVVLSKEVTKMLSNGVIEEVEPRATYKGWNSPVILVKKKDNSWRFCVDFRKLNQATYKDTTQLPRMDEMLAEVTRSRVFTKMDLAAGYWQIPVSEESKSLLAFEADGKRYCFNVMPFGITNAPAIFQKMMYEVLGGIPNIVILIDDIVIHTKTMEENLYTTKLVLERIKEHNLRINKKKCSFGSRELKLFGHYISEGTISPVEERVIAIDRMSKPSNNKELQVFFGKVNYYRTYIPTYGYCESVIRSKLTTEDNTVNWDEEANECYDILLQELKKLPKLYQPEPNEELILQTDASGIAVGAVLNTIRQGNPLPIGFYSRKLKDPETRYSVTERELLAVVNAVKFFRPYIYGRKFELQTDHEALVPIINKTDTSLAPKWNRRLLELSEFEIKPKHVPGKKNLVADSLSRLVNTITIQIPSLVDAQRADRESIEISTKDPRAFYEEDILHVKINESKKVIVLPQTLRQMAIQEVHELNHAGIKKTLHQLQERYYWKRMSLDVKSYIRSCNRCTAYSKVKDKASEAMNLDKEGIWTNIAIDLASFNLDNKQYDIIVLIDMFSKFSVTKVLHNTTSNEVAEFLKETFHQFGIPKFVLCDNGANLNSSTIQNLYESLAIKKLNSSPYNPQGNGGAERVIGTLKSSIQKLVPQLTIVEALRQATQGYNNSVHESTKFSPFEVMFRRSPNLSLTNALVPDAISIQVKENLYHTDERRNDRLKKGGKVEERKFKPNDLVLKAEQSSYGKKAKFTGPYKVMSQDGPNHYTLEGVKRPVNIRKLRNYFPPREPWKLATTMEKSNQVEAQYRDTIEEYEEQEIYIPIRIDIDENSSTGSITHDYGEEIKESEVQEVIIETCNNTDSLSENNSSDEYFSGEDTSDPEENQVRNEMRTYNIRKRNSSPEEQLKNNKEFLVNLVEEYIRGTMDTEDVKDSAQEYVRSGLKDFIQRLIEGSGKALEWIEKSTTENYIKSQRSKRNL